MQKVRPLPFELGDGWAYSTGPDWVGLMVRRSVFKRLKIGAQWTDIIRLSA
jgi:hypothetical protein